MILESIVLLAIILSYMGFIPWFVTVGVFAVIYWLPKSIVKILNKLYPRVMTHISDNIALTFDDSPYGSEAEILKVLNKWDQKATFFIISDNVTNREVLVEMVRTGHQLGNHGKTNSAHVFKSDKALISEILECDKLIRSIYSEAKKELPTTMVYRPGCGVFTKNMIDIVENLGYRLVLGSVYPNDPIVRSGIINYYYIMSHLQLRDIVILHDRSWTVSLLNKLLPKLKQQNIHSVILSD